jgi:hypothetical protein
MAEDQVTEKLSIDERRRRVLDAIIRAAAQLTEASAAVVAAREGDEIVVVAVAGADPRRFVGQRLVPGDDALAYVLAGGQAMSLIAERPQAALPAADPAARETTMCLPCIGAEGAVGALELRRDVEPFAARETRVAELLADVVAAELESRSDTRGDVPTPDELSAELRQLAAGDPSRYTAVAWALEALLSGA